VEKHHAATVYDALARLAPPPPEATRERVLAGNRDALEAWWDRLGVGSRGLFRIMKNEE